MAFGRLMRFPGGDIPKEVLTGNAVLDDFLSALDRQLLGSAKVRLLTLAEIKDHLLEKKARFLETGCIESNAAEKAVESMGSPDELGRAQRNALKRKFIKICFIFGSLMGLFMGFFGLVRHNMKDIGPVAKVLSALAQGVFNGLFFGWFMTYVWPERQLPSASKADGGSGGPEAEGEFAVCYSKGMRRASYFITVFFVLMTPSCVILGIAGSLYPSVNKSLPFSWWVVLILGAISIFDLYFVRLVRREYKVNEEGILVEEFLGRNKAFSWKNLKTVGLLGDIRPWVPYYWKKVKYAEFQNDGRKSVRMFIYPDMVNADRLFILMEKKIRS